LNISSRIADGELVAMSESADGAAPAAAQKVR